MKNQNSKKIPGGIILSVQVLTIALLFSSCFGSRPVSYFSGGVLDTLAVEKVSIPDQVIQKGDILNIVIYSDNPEATAIFNQAGGTQTISSVATNMNKVAGQPNTAPPSNNGGYLVDNQGSIRMHALGIVVAEGKTKGELANEITDKLLKLGVLTNPYCVIRFSNFKVSVLGEVKSPGVFTLTGERVSALEAMGMAGDITDYGLKDKVILIREANGNRTYHQLNLLDPKVMNSPEFFLRQNDVLLVQATSKKPTAMDLQTLSYITVAATVVSSIAIFITLFK